MTSESRTPLRLPLTTRDLTSQQRTLVDLMREHQFGRIENVSVQAGQPIFDRNVKVVRAVRLSGKSGSTKVPGEDDFELKGAVRNLLDEMDRLENGTILSLEFRHGLPFLMEILASIDESMCQILYKE